MLIGLGGINKVKQETERLENKKFFWTFSLLFYFISLSQS